MRSPTERIPDRGRPGPDVRLTALAYNLRRMLNIVRFTDLMAALAA
jgi:hypothetical protein